MVLRQPFDHVEHRDGSPGVARQSDREAQRLQRGWREIEGAQNACEAGTVGCVCGGRMGRDREYRTRGHPHHLVGDRAEQEAFEVAAPVGAHHQQVCRHRQRPLQDHGGGIALFDRDLRVDIGQNVGRQLARTGLHVVPGRWKHDRLITADAIGRHLNGIEPRYDVQHGQLRAVPARECGGVGHRGTRRLAQVAGAQDLLELDHITLLTTESSLRRARGPALVTGR